METKLLEKFRSDFAIIKDSYNKLKRGELNLREYRIISGKYGIYPQPNFKDTNFHLVRFRVAAGRLDKKKLRYLLLSLANYKIKHIKLLHTQSIQIHDMTLDNIFKFIIEAFDYGFISLGSASNYPRNVICSSLSGVEEGEYINVLPYTELTNEFLLKQIDTTKIPDKLEIAFSNSPKNESHATFCDLGFVARKNKCFDVYIAGGLGFESRLGVLFEENVSPKQTLYFVKAMIDFYAIYGNYKDTHKSRSAYLQETLGVEGIKSAFSKCLENVRKTEKFNIKNIPRSVTKVGDGEIEENDRIKKQKQHGLYSVEYKPVCGYVDAKKFKSIYKNIEPLNQVEIRLTPLSGLNIINLTAKEAKEVYDATMGGAGSPIENSTVCAGSKYCTSGYADTEKLLFDCLSQICTDEESNKLLPRIHISGCDISCSAHQIASLGFLAINNKSQRDIYMLYHSGKEEQSKEVFAKSGALIKSDDIPKLLVELKDIVKKDSLIFEDWIKSNESRFNELVSKYELKI